MQLTEIEKYVIAAYEVIEAMKQAGLLEGTSDPVTSSGHQKLADAYARGWRPHRTLLVMAVLQEMKGSSDGEPWPEGYERLVRAGVNDYVGNVVSIPENN